MTREIIVGELRKMTDKKGLILQGCGEDLKEWEDGVNKLLTGSGISLERDILGNVCILEDEGLTNLLFDMDDVKLDVGKLAMRGINTHQQFGGAWLSNHLANKFEMGEELKSSMEPGL